jgi:hypothetical protein
MNRRIARERLPPLMGVSLLSMSWKFSNRSSTRQEAALLAVRRTQQLRKPSLPSDSFDFGYEWPELATSNGNSCAITFRQL